MNEERKISSTVVKKKSQNFTWLCGYTAGHSTGACGTQTDDTCQFLLQTDVLEHSLAQKKMISPYLRTKKLY